jgi:hypothetical protein
MAELTRLAPRFHAPIPPPESGWYSVRHSVFRDGTVGRLEATYDIVASLNEHRRRTLNGENLGPWPEPPIGTRCRIVMADGMTGPEFPQKELFPRFDRLPDDSWIVANARWWPGSSTNARLIANDGQVLADILLGDGIEHLQCDNLGNVWVGYFDEGIYAGAEEQPALGILGLNRFDKSGTSSLPPVCSDWNTWPLPQISDCYAMNVVNGAVWLCTYTDFPISRLGFDGKARIWTNNKCGAHLLAVDGDLVVLLGGYGEESQNGALLRLEQDVARQVGEFTIDIGDLHQLPLAGSRGDTLHFVEGDAWSRLSVADIARVLL